MSVDSPRWLMVLTDETVQDRFSHAELAGLVAEGGADLVQFREKRADTTASLVRRARAVARALEKTDVRLVIDDRADVALAVGAAGVHLGRDDLDIVSARRCLGPEALVGGTANDLDEALRVAEQAVDYVGVGPVFGTRSKANPAPDLGLAGLRRIVDEVNKPVLAIGNLTPERVGEVLDTGVRGIAVLSAIVTDADPVAATARFRNAMTEWK